MALRVSTVSEDVFINDLGIYISHPTVARDLTLEFDPLQLRKSVQLTSAIQDGYLTVDDGTYTIHATDYDPDTALIQELGYNIDALYISEAELASCGDVYQHASVYPISLNSTASVTRNIYVPAARWYTWQVAPGDKVVITGNVAAGTYTVHSIADQQNFIVEEAIVDSTGGSLSVFHPDAATRIGVDDTDFDHVEGNNLHDILFSIDSQLGDTASGISVSTHRDLDQLVHLISEDSYEEVTYSGIHPVSDITWTDDGKTTKIREEIYMWSGNHVSTLTTIQYDASGTEVERTVETYGYTGSKITSIDRSFT